MKAIDTNKIVTAQDIFNSIRYTTFAASGKFAKMPAAIQRELFGKAIFGKKDIRYLPNTRNPEIPGKIYTMVTTISRDYDEQSYTLDEVAELVNKGQYAEKGYKGYGYRTGRTAK